MKKIISAILTLSVIVSSFGFSAFAASGGDGLSAAIAAAKSKFPVSEEYKDFRYGSSENNGEAVWNLSWSKEDGSTISLSVDDSGRLIYYYRYDAANENGNKRMAPLITKEEGEAIARECIARVAPEISEKLTGRDTSKGVNPYSNEYSYTFYRAENGIPFYSDYVSISVNDHTKEVTNLNVSWHYDLSFQPTEGAISEKEASDILKGAVSPVLEYRQRYDGSQDKGTYADLVYYIPSDYKTVDPFTGEVYTGNYTWQMNESASPQKSMADRGGASGAGGSGLTGYTEEEQKKITDTEKLITAEAADKIIRANKYLAVDDKFKLTGHSLNESYAQEGEYIWNLNYTGEVTKEDWNAPYASASLDAKTGELLSFYCYGKDDKTGSVNYGKEALGSIASDFLKSVSAEKYAKTVMEENNQEYRVQDTEQISYGFSFLRVNEGIKFPYNSMNVTVDARTGKVTNYYSNWTASIEFEPTKGIISAEQAEERIFAQCHFGLVYELYTTYYYDKEEPVSDAADAKGIIYPGTIPSDNTARLVYTLDRSLSLTVSAKSGGLLGYDGLPYAPNAGDIAYSDIAGHWIGTQAKLLSDIGIGFDGGSLLPDQKVKQKEFLYLLSKTSSYYYIPYIRISEVPGGGNDDMYKQLLRQGIIKKEEVDPEGEITKIEAIRFVIRAAGLAKAAELEGIYKTPFADDAAIPPADKGYCALAYGLGIVSGNGGNLSPGGVLTRAQSLSVIYNYLES